MTEKDVMKIKLDIVEFYLTLANTEDITDLVKFELGRKNQDTPENKAKLNNFEIGKRSYKK